MTEKKPPGSITVYFGSMLRKRRRELNLTQDQLGEKIGYTNSMVGSVETGKRLPSLAFVEGVERELSGDGSFLELWPAINEEKYPSWFADYAELEEQAICIQNFEAQLVPGLLQTEAYARALLSRPWPPVTAEELEQRVSARMDRREILEKSEPPQLWALLDEAVLRRPIAEPSVMREQWRYLIDQAQRLHIYVQILPFSLGWHAGINGAFTLLETSERERWAYAERIDGSAATADSDSIAVYTDRMRKLHAAALSPEASLQLLSDVIGG